MSNDKSIINPEELYSLWSVNVTKMHFQQNVCFQLRSWAFVITAAVIPLIWAGEKSLCIRVLLHLITILIIGLILHKDLSWHGYFFKYADRARLIEEVVVNVGEIDRNLFVKKYDLNRRVKNPRELLSDTFSDKHFFRLQTDLIELYMILLLFISLMVTIFLNDGTC